MGQSFRATLGAILILSGLVALILWCLPPRSSSGCLWWGLRLLSTGLAILSVGTLIWARTLKNKAPDFLARISTWYFERNGLCFTVVPEVEGGRSLLSIYFQN